MKAWQSPPQKTKPQTLAFEKKSIYFFIFSKKKSSQITMMLVNIKFNWKRQY